MTRVELRPGADVDAAGRLVEQQDLGRAEQPAREHDLLLVAAGQGADRRGSGRRAGRRGCGVISAASALSRRRSSQPTRANRVRVASETLRVTLWSRSRAWALRSSGASAEARRGPRRSSPARRRSSRPATTTRPAVRRARAVDGLEDLRAAGADQAREADDLARADRDVHVAEGSRRARAPRPGAARRPGRLGPARAARREDVLDVAAGHQRDDVAGGGAARRQAGGDGAAVLEHGDDGRRSGGSPRAGARCRRRRRRRR